MRVLIFANGKFLKISSFWYSPNVSVKINGKTGRSRWKNCCYWLILKKKAELTNNFCAHFFSCIYFREIWILRIFSVYLFLRKLFKILRLFNFAKCNLITSSKIKSNILKIILPPWYEEWLKQWKYLSFIETKIFVFWVKGFWFFKSIKKRENLYRNLREVSPCYLKTGFQFYKLTFFRGSEQAICKFT